MQYLPDTLRSFFGKYVVNHLGGLRKLWGDLKSSLGFRPALWMFAMSLLAVTVVAIDRIYNTRASFEELPFVFQSSADGARTMLGAIGTAMLTVTSLAFSILMVAVTQTANAYSPRLLRQYFSDRHNQHVLGILIGTFLYSLIVLRGVQVEEDRTFIPLLGVNIALVLAVVATAALVSLLNHVAQSIKVSNIILLILQSTQDVVAEAFPRDIGESWPGDETPLLPVSKSAVVASRSSGYIQIYSADRLLEIAVEQDLVLELLHLNGDFVMVGVPLVRVWPESAVDAQLAEAITDAVIFGSERTFPQDVRFGVRQLADVAIRALSPGINDPTTAIDAINSLAALLVEVLRRGPISPYRCDEQGTVRLRFPELEFTQMLDEAFTQLLHYGREDSRVLSHVIKMCGEIGTVAPDPKDRKALWQLVLTAVEIADRQLEAPFARRSVNIAVQQAALFLERDAARYLLDVEKPAQFASGVGDE